jgi:uncharacterized protein (TIRG00374 family)
VPFKRFFAGTKSLSLSNTIGYNERMQLGKNVKRRLILSLFFGVLVYVGLAIFGDVRSVIASLKDFRWSVLPVIFALALANYVLRFLRWAYYLRVMNISLPLKDSVTVFMSGLAMSISPGKLGELIKSYFLKKMTDTAMSRSVPIVFAERFTDFFAIVALAGVGAFSFRYGEKLIWVGAAGTLLILVIVMNRPLTVRLIDALARLPVLQRPAKALHQIYEGAYTLLRPGPLVIAIFFGVTSWFCECMAYWVTIDAFGFRIGVFEATFIYAFATFFGAITMLPGGLGTTEGTLTGLAMLQHVPKNAASAATIVIRVTTLWFAVALGLLWLAPNRQVLIPDKEEMDSLGQR